MKVKTGKGEIALVVLVAILSVSAIVSLPGLAISPILDDLDKIFPKASELEVEMLESLPSLMIIPFMLFAGGWSIRGNKIRLLVVGTTIFLLSGIGSLLARSLVELIVLGAIMGVGAARRMSNVNWGVVKELVLTWVFTFPGCGLLGFGMAKLFLILFA